MIEGKHRGSGAKTEEQEDADMVQDEIQQEEAAAAWPTHFDEQPSFIAGGQMRYLSWRKSRVQILTTAQCLSIRGAQLDDRIT